MVAWRWRLGFAGGLVAFAAACSFDWDAYDPRGAGGASTSGGAAPTAGAGGAEGGFAGAGGVQDGGGGATGGGGAGGAGPITLTFGERPGADVPLVTQDTYLSSTTQGSNHGADELMWADAAAIPSDDELTPLLRFELSAIPTAATVLTATLSLWTSTDSSAGSRSNTEFFALLESWDESANWTKRTSALTWANAGAKAPGSRATALLGTVATPAIATEYQLDVTALVQGWISDPTTNHGIVLAQLTDDGAAYATSECSDPARRPQLSISYLP